jgi:hypothetical protein
MDPLTPRRPPPSVLAVVVRVPYDGSPPQSHAAAAVLAGAIRAALATREGHGADPVDDDGPSPPVQRLDVVAIGPHQINRLDGDLVTVAYPVGTTTVLSVQPDGTIETRPPGASGPYERAILKPDRLIYAPVGPHGKVFIVPYVDALPNPE